MIVERILVAGRATWFYAGKIAWPYPTLFFYPRWTIDASAWWQWLYPVGAVVVPIGLWLARKKIGRGPLAAVLIYVGVLMPTLGFLNVYFYIFSFVADHFQYHASPALIALEVAGAVTWFARFNASAPPATELPAEARAPEARTVPRVIGCTAAAAWILTLAVLSFRVAGHYQNEETLYDYTVAKNPGSWSAWSNLGLALGEQGRFDEAIDDLKRAIEIAPGNARVQYNYAKLVIDRGEKNGFRPGDVAEALAHFREAVRLQPGWSPPEIGIGVALLRDNRADEAQGYLERGLALEPDNVDVLCALAVVMSERGNLVQAQQHFEHAVAVAPERPDIHYSFGQLLAKQDKLRPAAEEFAEAVRLRPDYVAAWNSRAIMYARLGEIDRTVDCFREVVRLQPDSAEARGNLDKALEWQRQGAPSR